MIYIYIKHIYSSNFKDVKIMGASNKICPKCGRKMKQQFIGLQHCKCGMSWKKDIGFLSVPVIWSLHCSAGIWKESETGSCNPEKAINRLHRQSDITIAYSFT